MWTVNDCDASKKRKAFKNSDNGKLRGGGEAREGVGRERKGVEGPTPTDLLADRSDGLVRPVQQPRSTGWTASADRSKALDRLGGRPRATGRSAVAEAVHAYKH